MRGVPSPAEGEPRRQIGGEGPGVENESAERGGTS